MAGGNQNDGFVEAKKNRERKLHVCRLSIDESGNFKRFGVAKDTLESRVVDEFAEKKSISTKRFFL